ncbi:MAG: DNA-3-methyladenine glycosylase [Planctomycetota bacterium]|nr:DNA-3-methyladenine glycosylase [Planctomycetota bacterium]
MACQIQQELYSALPRSFYDRDVVVVARDLLGKKFCRRSRQGMTCGTIVEVEAYRGAGDPASHSFRGKTPRNLVMFGSPGHLYVYSIHAKFCLNAVTGPQGTPSAVLIRAIEPTQGIPLMQRRRDRTNVFDLARGPARLCQAVEVSGEMNGVDLTLGSRIWISRNPHAHLNSSDIVAAPRIGVTTARDVCLRFFVDGSRFVSGPRHWHRR